MAREKLPRVIVRCTWCNGTKELKAHQVKEENFCCTECFYEYRRASPPTIEPKVKWEAFVDKTPGQGPNGDCWIWTGPRTPTGYGIFQYPKKNTRGAHVASYWIHTEDFDTSGHEICHHCDNPPCVNPAHLFKGDVQINAKDCNEKGRRPKGETHYRAKFNAEQVREIRKRYLEGVSVPDIAKEYGVNQTTLYYIISRKAYANVD